MCTSISVIKQSKLILLITCFIFVLSACACTTSENHSTQNRDTFEFYKTSEHYAIDGSLSESFWVNGEPLVGFRVDSDPEQIPVENTEVYLAYSTNALLAAFVCEEKMIDKLTEAIVSSGLKAWKGDYCELQVFSRPETPYYSPFLQRLDYKNANNKARTQRHFTITAAGAKQEGNIYKVGPHTSYITDDSWECEWQAAVTMLKDRYIIELSIPWSEIGGFPQPGHSFRLGFIRHRSETIREISRFNWYSGENFQVETFDPAHFIQEHPVMFAPVVFHDDHAKIKRYVETTDPWTVKRDRTEYKNVLTGRTVELRAAHFYLGIRGFLLPDSIKNLYTDETWALEEDNFIDELGNAGALGPFLPGFLNQKGDAALDSLYKRYGMKFTYHGSVSGKRAMDAGATILRPRGTPAFFDPVYAGLKNSMLEEWLKKYGTKPWLFDIRGQDEPFNQIATIRMPGMYERVNKELMEEYGVDMGVPPGIPGIPYQDQAIDENSRTVADHATALSRIATFRWLNKRFYEVAKDEYEIVRKYAPGKLYQAYNRNAVADMDFLDQSLIYEVTDYFSADPYSSFNIYVYGTARSRYHVGFTGKFVTDLAAGKPTQMIIQGCEMIQRLSTPKNIREWTSQAAKAGVTMLDWWGNPRLHYPEVYHEMLRLSKLWKNLPALDIPVSSDIAVLFSDDSRVAAGDEGLQSHYTLHALLGEKAGAWFSFISENHVRRGLQSLTGKKLIIAPQCAYLSKAFAQNLIDQVENGAVLIILDPDALTYDIESGSLSQERMGLLGIPVGEKREAFELIPTQESRKRFAISRALPLRPMKCRTTLNARVLDVPGDARVLFTYPDGSSAAYSRTVGNGEVIVFGAMPFNDSELAIVDSGWDDFFVSVINELGIDRDLPLWKFMFSADGGEVKTHELLISR